MFDELEPGAHSRLWFRHRDAKARRKYAAIPKRARLTFEANDFEPSDEQQALADHMNAMVVASPEDKYKRGVRLSGEMTLVTGPRQVGRTTGACWAMHDVITRDERKRVSGRYVTAAQLCEMFTDAARNDGVLSGEWEDPHLLHAIRSCFDILIIDDFGTEPLTDFRTDSMYSLLQSRANAMMPTYVIKHTSLTEERLNSRYPDQMVDLLLDFDEFEFVVPVKR